MDLDLVLVLGVAVAVEEDMEDDGDVVGDSFLGSGCGDCGASVAWISVVGFLGDGEDAFVGSISVCSVLVSSWITESSTFGFAWCSESASEWSGSIFGLFVC